MVVDSMRRDFLSCYGGRFQTPNMDRIADMGVRFNSFITHAPETYASIGSLLYGRYDRVYPDKGHDYTGEMPPGLHAA